MGMWLCCHCAVAGGPSSEVTWVAGLESPNLNLGLKQVTGSLRTPGFLIYQVDMITLSAFPGSSVTM